jgi:HNH endonuclease
MPAQPIPIFHPVAIERFWSRVLKTDDCWFWTGPLDEGYGNFVGIKAHRFSWAMTNGPIPPNSVICHSCNNPPCVNPAHLFPDTNENNQRHRFRQGRIRVPTRDWSWLRRPTVRITREQRFIIRIAILENGCWEWIGGVSAGTGYGIFCWRKGWAMSAHRASWLLHHPTIPDGLWVLHRCDNRCCVNPLHLWLGTQRDNMQDMAKKGRAVHVNGENCGRVKLTELQVLELRRLHAEEGLGCTRLGRLFGISERHAGCIVNRLSWRHI